MLTDADAATGDRAACTTLRRTFVATPMARDFRSGNGTQSPVIIMSDEFNGSGQNCPWEGGRTRHAADGDQSSCLPLLVVPGLTPRSSASSQSCLSVPGVADINGYSTSLISLSYITPELDMGWIHPWVGSGRVGLGWVGSGHNFIFF